MAEDLEHFIKAMALGIPTIKPDEKRAFLVVISPRTTC